jgi:hypothetical protein
VLERQLSVRQTEELVRRKREESPSQRRAALSNDLADLEAQLRGVLATKVGIVRTRRGGRLVIDFYSDEELDRLYSIITRGAGGGAGGGSGGASAGDTGVGASSGAQAEPALVATSAAQHEDSPPA